MTRKEYVSHLNSNRWKRIRRKRMKYDGKQCTACHSKTKLTVHHLNYDHFGDEKMNDIITLCQSCHFAVHHPNHPKTMRPPA